MVTKFHSWIILSELKYWNLSPSGLLQFVVTILLQGLLSNDDGKYCRYNRISNGITCGIHMALENSILFK